METEAHEVQAARKDGVARKAWALEALTMRIARLAIDLDIELDTDTALQKALAPGLMLQPQQWAFGRSCGTC